MRILAVWVTLALVLLPVAGWASESSEWLALSNRLAPGGTIDFTPHGSQPGLSYSFEPSDSCGNCHAAGGNSPPTASTFLPHSTWSGSMMANATRDPVFFAALDVANHDVPGVGDYCLRCHTSQGWYGGHVVKAGFGGPNNDATMGAAACLLEGRYDHVDYNNDYSGVACHFCHRMMAQGPLGQPPYTENANAWLDDGDCDGYGEPCRRGPYAYSGIEPPHAWTYSPFHLQSNLCGTCHNVSTPDTSVGPLKTLVLNNGTDTARPFPIERTFSEWQQSLYADAIFRDGVGDLPPGIPAVTGAKACQGCHMPTSFDANAQGCTLGSYPNRTGNLPVHAFVGGNTWVPGIIKGEYGAGLGPSRVASLDQTVNWSRQMLQASASVAASVQNFVAPTPSVAGNLSLQIKVTNLGGHKLPTGYAEGRRMWLNVQVRDNSNALVFESGNYNATTGVLTQDAQARVYEVKQGIWNGSACATTDGGGAEQFHFVLNNCIAKDNRIPPLAFHAATVDDPNGYDTRPVGATYPETISGSGILVNFDNAPFTAAIPAATPLPLHVTATLYYQTSSKEYIEFLRDEASDNAFAGENSLCSAGPSRPFTVGPQTRSRGEYLFQLWNNPPGGSPQPGYGKSPPEAVQMSSLNVGS
ncbi:MAG: hypothetical protein ABI451_08430 [Dokdonella sp.]